MVLFVSVFKVGLFRITGASSMLSKRYHVQVATQHYQNG